MADSVKQNVQWFPGHMAKTRRKITENLNKVDGVVVMLDARIPYSSTNPELTDIVKDKPCIYILNKSDLADGNTTTRWIEFYKSKGIVALNIDCRSNKWTTEFRKTVEVVLKDVIDKNISKGMVGKTLRLMVLGIPNTGKSTFINRLSGNSKAKAEDRAGVTKQSQWYNCGGGIEILDTPGVLWPKFDDSAVGDKLAFTGGVKDQIFDMETLAVRFLEIMKTDYPKLLTERYKITDFEQLQGYQILELIGKKRGMLVRGGEVDTLRVATTLFDEYRAGKIGRISLEKPL